MMRMIHGICALLLSSVLAGPVFVQTAGTASIILIETGEFRAASFMDREDLTRIEEAIATTGNGDKWLGLYVTAGRSSLIESKVTIKPLVDPKNGKEVIGKRIGVDQRAGPVFLVKNAAMLKSGPVWTVYNGGGAKAHELPELVDTGKLASIKPRRLKLEGREYQLIVKTAKAGPGEKLCAACFKLQLALTAGNQTQVISSEEPFNPAIDSTIWRLLWAGDIDGDGKLDLYQGVSSAALGDYTNLFLSSQARPGQLVKSVATFLTAQGR